MGLRKCKCLQVKAPSGLQITLSFISLFFRAVFWIAYFLRNTIRLSIRQIVRFYDWLTSLPYPYVWRNVQLEYVPQHVMLTGGLVPHQQKAQRDYMEKLADAVATGYDCAIDLFTLHVPYTHWSYEQISGFSSRLNLAFKKLGYRAFVSFIQKDVDPQMLVEQPTEDSDAPGDLFTRNVNVVILSPNANASKLASVQLVIQLLDKRHSSDVFCTKFQPQLKPQQLINQMPGLSPDYSGLFNRPPDLIINFGGDFNQTMQNIPFWLLRKAYIKNIGGLKGFYVNSFVRCARWYDHIQAAKFAIVQGK